MTFTTSREDAAKPSWFLDAVGELGTFTGRLLKNFLRLFLRAAGLTLLLACAACFAAGNGQIWRGAVAAGLTLAGGGILAFLVAGKLSIVISVSDTVREKAIGQRILDALFGYVLGVTNGSPHGSAELTRELHGMPISQLKAGLDEAGQSILESGLATAPVPKFTRWLARKVQRLLVWATIRVVVAYATANKTPDESVDLLALRSSLAGAVDELLVRQISEGAFRFALLVAFFGSLACWWLVELLRRVPLWQP